MKVRTRITFHDGADPIHLESIRTHKINLKPGTKFEVNRNGGVYTYEIVTVNPSDEFVIDAQTHLTTIRVACKELQ